MNWEALAAIGAVTVVLGVILLIPALYWARRKARQASKTPLAAHITPVGYLYLGITLVLFFGGIATLRLILPREWADRPASHVAMAVYVFIWWATLQRTETYLKRRGIEIMRTKVVTAPDNVPETKRDS